MKGYFDKTDVRRCATCKKPETETGRFNHDSPNCPCCQREYAKTRRKRYQFGYSQEKRGYSNNKPVRIFEDETEFNNQPFAWIWQNA